MQNTFDQQQAEDLPIFLDLEASSLNPHKSYPTEVAWSLPDGSIQSCLVRPEPDWKEWHAHVERLTGISRALIEESGLPPAQVADKLNHDLAGHKVFCDGGYHDRLWMQRLFEAANRPCNFTLHDITHIITPTHNSRPDWPDRLREMEQQARFIAGPPHRAERDVAFLIQFYELVRRAAMSSPQSKTELIT